MKNCLNIAISILEMLFPDFYFLINKKKIPKIAVLGIIMDQIWGEILGEGCLRQGGVVDLNPPRKI